MKSIFDYDKIKLREFSKKANFMAFKGNQLYDWVFDKFVIDINFMRNLDFKYKEFISKKFIFSTMNIIKEKKSKDNMTFKILLEIVKSKETIEIVIMRYLDTKKRKYRNTVCLSSQIGCIIKCPFCATGKQKFIRNLTSHEIVEQFIISNIYLKKIFNKKEKIKNIVFMGMGEPFFNWNNVIKSIKKFNADFKINENKITVSTSGIIPKINKLSNFKNKCVLAISLHASNDNLRNELVPINKKYPLKELIKSCKNYIKKTKKRITFEYIMISKKNINIENINELKKLLKNLKCSINIINLNKTHNMKYARPNKNEIDFFCNEMKKNGFLILNREIKGNDINGACGQLKYLIKFDKSKNKERKKNEKLGN